MFLTTYPSLQPLVYLCVSVFVSEGHGGQVRSLRDGEEPLELELQAMVSHPTQRLGTGPGSFGRTAGTPHFEPLVQPQVCIFCTPESLMVVVLPLEQLSAPL